MAEHDTRAARNLDQQCQAPSAPNNHGIFHARLLYSFTPDLLRRMRSGTWVNVDFFDVPHYDNLKIGWRKPQFGHAIYIFYRYAPNIVLKVHKITRRNRVCRVGEKRKRTLSQ